MTNFKAHTTSDTIVFESGLEYSSVDIGDRTFFAEFTVPADAAQRPGKDSDYWNWTIPIPGGNINIQAYGQDTRPGVTSTFKVEVRQKRLPKDKGGYRFLFLKLTPTSVKPNSQVVVGKDFQLRAAEDLNNEDTVIVWCPQMRHRGGIIITPIEVSPENTDRQTLKGRRTVTRSRQATA